MLDFLNLHLTIELLRSFEAFFKRLCFSVAEISLAHKVLELFSHITSGLSLTRNILKKASKTGVRSILKVKKTSKFVVSFFMKDFSQFCD